MRFSSVGPVFIGLWLSAGGCSCEETTLTPQGDAGPGRCLKDEDCPSRNACNVSIGLCYPKDACAPDRPCPQMGQICADVDGDGFLDCEFERCQADEECSAIADECRMNLEIATCSAGGCICGAPCDGGCPDGQGCCVPTDSCQELPPLCMGLACPLGQFLSVTSSGAWDLAQCELLGETCRCEVLPPLPAGDIGLHSALAHDGLSAVATAYNLTYGDLMFGIVQTSGDVDWEFVDGVPSSTTSITGDLDGPRAGNSDPGDDVGKYTDVAVDSTARPHVAYHDVTHGSLKYATQSANGWLAFAVDDRGTSGLYASIALSANVPRIAYLSARETRQDGTRVSTLRVAIATTSAPTSASDFVIRDVESLDVTALGCEDACDPNEVCRARDHACLAPDPSRCSACGSGERCLDGACTSILSTPVYRDVPNARGVFTSIATSSDGSVWIGYHDRIEQNFKIARFAGPDPTTGALTVTVIDGPGTGTTDVTGAFSSLFITPGDEVHVAYENASKRSVVYRQLTNDLTTIVSEEVETGLSAQPDAHFLGADIALVVDSSAVARVAYQDATLGELRYARRRGPNDWITTTLRGNEDPYVGSFGFYTDQTLAPDRSTALVSTYRFFLSGGPDNGLEVFDAP
ncbi:MAG: hypothetical protein HY791_23560 [Deltaproteobacteria bacterium]|nr:hypothetical protein [Deltaproteobacteria bacterium]